MKALLIWTMLTSPVLGQEFVVENKIAPVSQFVVENKIQAFVPRVVIPVPEPTTNIFADYPDAKLRAALQPPAQPSRYTSPPGYHRHVATDGTVIEHSDSNNYKPVVTPAAHQNLVQSADGTWPQYTGPRAPSVRLPYATGYQPVLGVGYCPPNRP